MQLFSINLSNCIHFYIDTLQCHLRFTALQDTRGAHRAPGTRIVESGFPALRPECPACPSMHQPRCSLSLFFPLDWRAIKRFRKRVSYRCCEAAIVSWVWWLFAAARRGLQNPHLWVSHYPLCIFICLFIMYQVIVFFLHCFPFSCRLSNCTLYQQVARDTRVFHVCCLPGGVCLLQSLTVASLRRSGLELSVRRK